MKINNAVALVSGSNRGIGKALVTALIDAGARKIYASSRQVSEQTFEAANTEIVPLQLDICDANSVQDAANKAKDINMVFNNAGVLDFGDILGIPIDLIKRNINTNFYGTLEVSRVMAALIESNGGGAIVNTLSLLSLASMPGLAAYNASKAAAWSMTLSLRASLADRNIAVHSVFPGAVDTDMLDGVEMPKTSPADVARSIIDGVAKGEEDIFPDPMSIEIYAAWCKQHKAVEKQFAKM